MSDDNQWNLNAKEMNETLFLFAAGNLGQKYNNILDYYEFLIASGTAKNLLTVVALSSIPISETEDKFKSIYFYEVMARQTFKPEMKVWSLKKSNDIKKRRCFDIPYQNKIRLYLMK